MDFIEMINKRRAYRSISPEVIDDEMVNTLVESVRLTPSCFNNQPWRFLFVRERSVLEELHTTLSRGNAWARTAPMIVAVFSRKELDCLIKEREYYLFDTGMATALLILRATELGLVAHPIAGYDEKPAKEVLGIPEEMKLITLLIVGRRAGETNPVLSGKQQAAEALRPERLPPRDFAYMDRYQGEDEG